MQGRTMPPERWLAAVPPGLFGSSYTFFSATRDAPRKGWTPTSSSSIRKRSVTSGLTKSPPRRRYEKALDRYDEALDLLGGAQVPYTHIAANELLPVCRAARGGLSISGRQAM